MYIFAQGSNPAEDGQCYELFREIALVNYFFYHNIIRGHKAQQYTTGGNNSVQHTMSRDVYCYYIMCGYKAGGGRGGNNSVQHTMSHDTHMIEEI